VSEITTGGTWVRLPTALGAADRARADQPGDAALFQLLASNATLATRENELRVLWERLPIQVWADCTVTNDERTLLWSGDASAGVLAQWCGTHRVRLYGEQQRPPRLVLSFRGAAPAAQTLGVILLAMPAFGDPDVSVPTQGVVRHTTTTMTDLSIAVDLTPATLGRTTIVPSPTGSPLVTTETGDMPSISVFVGAWCTSNSSGAKASLGGMTLYLEPPTA
jgi:hypothetical protein